MPKRVVGTFRESSHRPPQQEILRVPTCIMLQPLKAVSPGRGMESNPTIQTPSLCNFTLLYDLYE